MYWKEYNNGNRAYLLKTEMEKVAYVEKKDFTWHCKIYLKPLFEEELEYFGMDSIEVVEWQLTLYINKKCTVVANELCKIRSDLPSIHELADRAGIGNWEEV